MTNNLDINSLLERKSIIIESAEIEIFHRGKSILVTGGAGSIGSELVRQICKFSPKKILVLDQGETPLHELQLELNDNFPSLDIEYILADVSDRLRLKQIFVQNQFDIVYHAAAYKYVPIVEQNPREAVRVNILGTKNIAELSLEYGVGCFVMISTDKAVNPISIMGMTKRIAELFIHFLHQKSKKTKFITTRFGNVLGSNGSVVYRFIEQIKSGKPITVTHPEITRYFMTIEESCRLVLQSVAIGKGGEICVFDMGEPIKIVDLAKKIAQVYHKTPEIIFTGLREGDKMNEELFNHQEKIDFVQEKIMFSNSFELDYQMIEQMMKEVGDAFQQEENIDWKNYLKFWISKF